MRRFCAPTLCLATFAVALPACHFGVGITPCRNGGSCPGGTTCDTDLGVCRSGAGDTLDTDATTPPPDDEGAGTPTLPPPGDDTTTPPPDDPPANVGGEGEGEGEPAVTPAPVVVCGDNVRGGREACDDGNRLSGDGCSSTCRLDASALEVEPNDFPNDSGSFTLATSSVFKGGIDTMHYDPVVNQSFSEFDTFWIQPTVPSVVRIESYDQNDIDDCAGSNAFYVDLHREDVATVWEQAFLRGAWDNGNGRCAVLTTTLEARPHLVRIMEDTGTALIPDYRIQVTVLEDRGAEVEPNNTIAAAEREAIDALDATMSGTIATADDVDIYAVQVPPGRGLRAEVIPTAAATTCDAFNAKLSLLDEGGVERVARASAVDACAFIDGTGDAPRMADAANRTFAMKSVYVAVTKGSSGLAGALPYKITFTVR